MTPEVSDFIPGSLEDRYKHIEVADVHHVTARQKDQVQIQMCDNNRDPFIATLHNVLLAPNLCNRLFSIITLMSLVHTCLFHKWFCTVYSGAKEKFSYITTYCTKKICILGGNQGNFKGKEIIS